MPLKSESANVRTSRRPFATFAFVGSVDDGRVQRLVRTRECSPMRVSAVECNSPEFPRRVGTRVCSWEYRDSANVVVADAEDATTTTTLRKKTAVGYWVVVVGDHKDSSGHSVERRWSGNSSCRCSTFRGRASPRREARRHRATVAW